MWTDGANDDTSQFEFESIRRPKHPLSHSLYSKTMANTRDTTLKRTANAAFIPDSMLSYMMGALKTSFDHLKSHISHDCAFAASKPDPSTYLKQLLEEMLRYLYLLAGNSSDGVVRSSPSYFVDQAFHCLMLDPVLYFKVCREILAMQGLDEVDVPALPHDALGGQGDDAAPRKARYLDTLVRYKQTFGQDPPLGLWSDYSDDSAAVTAELEAHQAQQAAISRPHHVHSRPQGAAPIAPEPSVPAAVSPQAQKIKDEKEVKETDAGKSITIRVKNQAGDESFYKILRTTRIARVRASYAERFGVSLSKLRFTLDGVGLWDDKETAADLELEDGDQIDVLLAVTGC